MKQKSGVNTNWNTILEVFKVEVYDSDDDKAWDLSKHDFIGALEF